MPTLYWKNAAGDGTWENPLNWFTNAAGTTPATAAPWVYIYDPETEAESSAYNDYDLTLATGETGSPTIGNDVQVFGMPYAIATICDINNVTNNGNISDGTFSGDGFINAGLISGYVTFTGNGFTNNNFIYSGTFSGDEFTNNSIIYSGTFSGDLFYNYSYIVSGTFSGSGFSNNGTIDGGTFSGDGFNNYGYINGGTFSGDGFISNGGYIYGGTFTGNGFVGVDSNIIGGTFTGSGFTNLYGTISDGTFSGSGFFNGGTIVGGTFTGNGFTNGNEMYDATINGGTFTGDGFVNNGTIGMGLYPPNYAPNVYRTLSQLAPDNVLDYSMIPLDPGFAAAGGTFNPTVNVIEIPQPSDILGTGLL